MQTQHGDWLRQLAADSKGGVTLPSITRGEGYKTSFELEGDYSADTFSASLALAPDVPTVADFNIAKAFNGTATLVTLSLSDTIVNALPADGDANGLAELVFSVQHTPAGSIETRLFAGNVFISGKV